MPTATQASILQMSCVSVHTLAAPKSGQPRWPKLRDQRLLISPHQWTLDSLDVPQHRHYNLADALLHWLVHNVAHVNSHHVVVPVSKSADPDVTQEVGRYARHCMNLRSVPLSCTGVGLTGGASKANGWYADILVDATVTLRTLGDIWRFAQTWSRHARWWWHGELVHPLGLRSEDVRLTRFTVAGRSYARGSSAPCNILLCMTAFRSAGICFPRWQTSLVLLIWSTLAARR